MQLQIQEETQVTESNIEVENEEEDKLSTASAITTEDKEVFLTEHIH